MYHFTVTSASYNPSDTHKQTSGFISRWIFILVLNHLICMKQCYHFIRFLIFCVSLTKVLSIQLTDFFHKPWNTQSRIGYTEIYIWNVNSVFLGLVFKTKQTSKIIRVIRNLIIASLNHRGMFSDKTYNEKHFVSLRNTAFWLDTIYQVLFHSQKYVHLYFIWVFNFCILISFFTFHSYS